MKKILYIPILVLSLQYLVIIKAAPKLVGDDKLVQDVTWYCTTICEGCGGKAQVDFKIPACICKIDSNVDDSDIFLIKDMAKKIGMNLKIEDGRTNKLSKRNAEDSEESEDNISSSKKPAINPLIFKLRSRLLNPLTTPQEESILGRSNIFDMEPQHNSLLPTKEFKKPLLDLGKNAYFGTKESTRNALSNMRSKIDSLIEKIDINHPESRRAMEEAEDLNKVFKDLLHKTARKNEDTFGKFGDKFGDMFQNLPKLKDLVGKGIPKKFQIQSKNKDGSENKEDGDDEDENDKNVEDKEERSGEEKTDVKKIITQPKMLIEKDEESEE